jgi:predicted NBD/HSP70 family sugar kinase
VLGGVVKELSPQVAFIANALDIDRLILGGLFEREFERTGPAFRREILRRRTYPDLAVPEIVSARRGDDAVAYGAAVHFTENLASQHFWREI